ncbi:hypothetical protein GGI08_008040, partial [Coemansia sp. S2]
MAALCLHSSPDDSIDGPLEVSLYAGLNNISGSEGSGRIVLPIAQAINAAIEIDDGLHVLYDYGSAGGVLLGHRRARVKRDAGYVISDGKLLWFGEVSFWYRVLDGSRWSKSPTPPWRDTHVTPDVSAFLHGDTMHASPRLNPHSSPLDSTHTREKPFAEHLVLSRARATLLRREEAVAVVSQSPDPQSSLVLTSPPGQFSPTRASPDRVASYPVSLLDDRVLRVDLIDHVSFNYDSDPESMAMDTEPLSQHSRGATPDYCP